MTRSQEPPVRVDAPEYKRSRLPTFRSRVRRWALNPFVFQIVVGVALLGVAVYEFDLRQAAHSFETVRWQWLVAVFAVYVASRYIHAVEWKITLTRVGNPPMMGLFGVTLIGTLVNIVIPASAGDVAKVQIIANRYGLPRSGLIAGRASEAIVNALFFVGFIALSFVLPGAGIVSRGVGYALIAAALSAFLVAAIASRVLPEHLPSWRIIRRLPSRMYEFAEEQWPRAYAGFEVLRRPRLLTINAGLNLVGWAADIAILWLFGQAFRLDVPAAAYVSLAVAVAAITVFPITIGNIGTYELLLTSVLVLYGASSADALGYALGTHVITAAFNIGLGMLALWIMRIQPREVFRMSREPEPAT